MSSSKNTPLLLLALVLASAAMLTVYMLRPGSNAEHTPDQSLTQALLVGADGGPAEGPEVGPAKAANEGSENTQGLDQDGLQAELESEFELLVMDGSGRELTEFSLTLDGPGGEHIERTSAGLIRGLAAGAWKVRGDAVNLLPGFGEVELVLGKRRRLVLQLLDTLRIEGTLVDNHGQPLPRVQVWLLGPGQSHPTSLALAKARLGTITGVNGRFELRPTEPEKYSISVGPPGAPRWTQRRGQELEPGGPTKVRVVIPSVGGLQLRMAKAPAGQAVDLLSIKVEVVSEIPVGSGSATANQRGKGEGNRDARQDARRETRGKPPREDGDKRQGNRPDNRQGTRQGNSRLSEDAPVGKSDGERFRRWEVVTLTEGDEKLAKSAPPQRELRLFLTRRGGRFECSPGFLLTSGILTRVTVPWPPVGATEGILGLVIERIPGPEGDSAIGCTWTQ
ncbi:MAG: hypothetical protein ACI8QC_001209 [Planctomycetota bacterium]|jgi:hypothetical protein